MLKMINTTPLLQLFARNVAKSLTWHTLKSQIWPALLFLLNQHSSSLLYPSGRSSLKSVPVLRILTNRKPKKIAAENLASCDDCDIKTNLWLNMHDGHLGCGRRHWDGSGANNHAVDHGQNSGHPIVCKLGTITPEGTASIYCYKCDDDVFDSKLAEHLKVLGINIAT